MPKQGTPMCQLQNQSLVEKIGTLTSYALKKKSDIEQAQQALCKTNPN